MKYWVENICTRLVDKELIKTRDWSYLGNSIINPYIKQLSEREFQYISKEDIYLTIEDNFMKDKKYRLNAPENYRYFWFENNFVEYIRHTPACKGVCLHNSWTPQFIKECSRDEFVNIDCTLSDFICGILGINNSKVYYYNFMQNNFTNSKEIDESDIIDINCSGNRYKMYLPDKNDADQRLVRLPKRPREVEVLYEMQKALGDNPVNGVLVDIGHNCGNHSAYFAALGTEVHAFEPNKHLSKVLQKTVEINSFTNITLYNVGLSDKIYETSFRKYNPSHSGSMSLNDENIGSLCEISVVPLDAYKLSFPYRKTIVKIDVEGMEINVLRGMKETLAEIKPEALFIEIHTLSQLKEITVFLSKYGYIFDRLMESHTCKFVRKTHDDINLFISDQKFLTKEIFDTLGRLGTNINNWKNAMFWNSLMSRESFVFSDEIYYTSVVQNHYFQLHIHGVPRSIHYEFIHLNGAMQCCLHCEDASLIPTYNDIFVRISEKMEAKCIVWSTLQINIDALYHNCIDIMKKLVSVSLEEIKSIQAQ